MNPEELIVAMQETKDLHPTLELRDILTIYHISEAQQHVLATHLLTEQIKRLANG